MSTELALLAGRLIFGGYFAFSGLNHFIKKEQLAGWAEHKGAPHASSLVLISGIMLVLGGLGIVAGAYPDVSIGMVGLFLAIVTPWFHDFWNFEGEEKQEQMTHFLKNLALFGALLTLIAADWTVYSVGMTLGII